MPWFRVASGGTLPRVVINHTGPVPLWQQIVDIIRARIDDGAYAPDTAIPSIMKLTEEFGVAEATVQKAVNALKRDGVLIGTPGRGTFVAS